MRIQDYTSLFIASYKHFSVLEKHLSDPNMRNIRFVSDTIPLTEELLQGLREDPKNTLLQYFKKHQKYAASVCELLFYPDKYRSHVDLQLKKGVGVIQVPLSLRFTVDCYPNKASLIKLDRDRFGLPISSIGLNLVPKGLDIQRYVENFNRNISSVIKDLPSLDASIEAFVGYLLQYNKKKTVYLDPTFFNNPIFYRDDSKEEAKKLALSIAPFLEEDFDSRLRHLATRTLEEIQLVKEVFGDVKHLHLCVSCEKKPIYIFQNARYLSDVRAFVFSPLRVNQYYIEDYAGSYAGMDMTINEKVSLLERMFDVHWGDIHEKINIIETGRESIINDVMKVKILTEELLFRAKYGKDAYPLLEEIEDGSLLLTKQRRSTQQNVNQVAYMIKNVPNKRAMYLMLIDFQRGCTLVVRDHYWNIYQNYCVEKKKMKIINELL